METVLVTTGRDRIIKDAPFKGYTARALRPTSLSYVHIRPRNDLESDGITKLPHRTPGDPFITVW